MFFLSQMEFCKGTHQACLLFTECIQLFDNYPVFCLHRPGVHKKQPVGRVRKPSLAFQMCTSVWLWRQYLYKRYNNSIHSMDLILTVCTEVCKNYYWADLKLTGGRNWEKTAHKMYLRLQHHRQLHGSINTQQNKGPNALKAIIDALYLTCPMAHCRHHI